MSIYHCSRFNELSIYGCYRTILNFNIVCIPRCNQSQTFRCYSIYVRSLRKFWLFVEVFVNCRIGFIKFRVDQRFNINNCIVREIDAKDILKCEKTSCIRLWDLGIQILIFRSIACVHGCAKNSRLNKSKRTVCNRVAREDQSLSRRIALDVLSQLLKICLIKALMPMAWGYLARLVDKRVLSLCYWFPT